MSCINKGDDFVSLRMGKFYDYLNKEVGVKMNNSVLSTATDNVVFESIEHLNMFSNVEVKLPDNIPIDCNLVCYSVNGDEIDFFTLYREADDGLYSLFKGGWEYSSESLEAELEFDKDCLSTKYIYVQVNRKTPKEETKDLFTPDCLVGVETDVGFITYVAAVGTYSGVKYYAYTTEIEHSLVDVHKLKFFISDYSDDVVSFKEYVELFYEG